VSASENENRYYNEHAALLGHVTLAWNDCQSMVLGIFHQLSGLTWDKAAAVFLALKSDQAQREITIALMGAVLNTDNDSGMRDLGTRLIGTLGKMAGERNAATHTMWVTVLPERKVEPHPTLPKPKTLRPDFKSQFEALTLNLRELFREFLKFEAALRVHMEQSANRIASQGVG
jgi:hypothetical protein